MTTDLEAVDLFITRMYTNHGLLLAVVGGAARDTYLGREPKDYDFVFLNTKTLTPMEIHDVLSEELGDVEALGGSGSYGGGSPELEYVWESRGFATNFKPFQFLLYNDVRTASFAEDAAKAVVLHDCSLNHAWLAKVNGRVLARVSDEFPNPATGNRNFFAADVSYDRKAYIRDKFPEFNHVI